MRIDDVTVLIACYNGSEFIDATLRSAAEQGDPVDILVVDDCSTDESWSILQRWERDHARVRVIRNPENFGVCATLNAGIAEIDTEFVIILGHDDLMFPNCAAILRNTIEMFGSQCSSVSALGLVGDEHGEVQRCKNGAPLLADSLPDAHLQSPGDLLERLLVHNEFNSCCIHRTAVVAEERYDPEMPYEDWDLWCRLSIRHRLGSTSEPVYIFRRPLWSLSSTMQSTGKEEIGRNALRRKFLSRSPSTDRLIVQLATKDAWGMLGKIRPADARATLARLPRVGWRTDLGRFAVSVAARAPRPVLLFAARVRFVLRKISQRVSERGS